MHKSVYKHVNAYNGMHVIRGEIAREVEGEREGEDFME